MRARLRLAALLAVTVLVPSTSLAPLESVTALARLEVWADGLGDLGGLAIDADGAVYVADHLAGTVTRISPDHLPTIVASDLDHPVGLAFDSAGHPVVAEERANRVTRIEGDGCHTPVISDIQQPRWVTFGPDGTLYVSARGLTSNGGAQPDDESLEPQIIVQVPPSGQPALLVDGFIGIEGLALHEHVLYAAARGRASGSSRGVVYAVPLPDGTAGPLTPVSTLDGMQRPLALAIDARGAIFATTGEPGAVPVPSERAVMKLRTDGSRVGFASGLAGPTGLAFDTDGNLFVADGSAGRVLKFHAPAPRASARRHRTRASLRWTSR